jgi:hypothetical protein
MRTEIASMILAPCLPLLSVVGLRYLFATFLRERALWFADLTIPRAAALVIGTRMALKTCTICGLAIFLFAIGSILRLPAPITAAPAALGVLAAVVVAIRIARQTLGIRALPAGLIGVVSFAGGGLPLIVLFPALLSLATVA